MPSVPRIVVVDATHEVARIVRGALALLNRQHVLIEVPDAENALEEIAYSTPALVVTAYQIPGYSTGVDLAAQVCHGSLGTPVIVLAAEEDPRLDERALAEAPFQYYMRPVGEPFLRGLRFALDGESAVVAEQQVVQPESDLGPVPSIEVRALRTIILSLMRDVGAMGVILADRTGRVLVDEGATGYVDREKLAVILGPSFARSTDISPLIGGHAWTMHYYDGERLDVFGLSLGAHFFMCLIFEGSNRAAFGAVMMFGRRAADQMIDMLGEAAYLIKQPEPLPAPVKEKPAPKKEPQTAVEAPAPRLAKKPAETPAPKSKAKPEPQPLENLNFDADSLFGQAIDENLADSLFSAEALESLASSMISENGERVGYDEAIDMGILDES